MSLANSEDLRRKLRLLGSEFDNVDLKEELEEANRKLQLNIGRYYSEKIYIKDIEKLIYRFSLSPIIKFGKVYVSGIGELDEDVYEVNEREGTIIFNEPFKEFDIITLYYIPEIFKDLEILYACESIMSMSFLVTSDEVKGSMTEKIKERIKILEQTIQRRYAIIPFAEKREVDWYGFRY